MSLPLFSTPIRQEQDIVFARQRTRQIAQMIGFDGVEQTRIATAVSEIARNAFSYGGGGKIEFNFDDKTTPHKLIIRVSDNGPGIPNLQEILDGRYKSTTGMGLGIIGTKRILDDVNIQTSAQGTIITLTKYLPRHIRLTTADLNAISARIFQENPLAPLGEVQQQNRELLETLQELERRKEKLELVNTELEETNRGVVALYAELDERAEQLKQADQMKTRFLSYMSHEFRTPVNSTLSLTRFLLDRTDGDLSPEQEKQVTLIRKSMESLLDLVNDLLDLAKVEAGRVPIYPESCKVEDIFSVLRGMFRPLITNPEVGISFEVIGSIPSLHTDEGKVSQILRNFISNAIKFTERGLISVIAQYDKTSRTVSFSVTDTGIGIAPEDQGRIFEEFSQVFHTLQKKARGTGLGLPLSKKLAELLGGSIELQSSVGEGATFKVIIPIEYAGEQEESSVPQSFRNGNRSFVEEVPGHLRILVIDDEEASYYTLKRTLQENGHSVIEVSDPTLAVDIAKNERPDLIFLDLIMPKMRGHIVLDQLKDDEQTMNIPVIVHSNSILSADETEILMRRSLNILPKDISSVAVKAFVEDLPARLRVI